ncbi:MAG TPA: P1 family peptidase [Pyrinomonadaceae bacterium]|nr:P1 family peptidase [Pyrinomonadaceae bacterium]
MNKRCQLSSIILILLSAASVFPQNLEKKRARDLGIPFPGMTGKFNAITDVPGVEVGYTTLIRGIGKWKVGEGPVRTGVTVVLPRGKSDDSYNAGHFIFNGDGEMTGIPYMHDYGRNSGAIGITNTNSVGVVRDAIGEWQYRKFASKSPLDFSFGLPIVAETWDGLLNDINGYHVKKEHVFEAINGANAGRIAEGNVGGGTGMVCYWFKGGTGTSSRIVQIGTKEYTVGVLVQANFGRRDDLTVAGVPVGKEIQDLQPIETSEQDGSIIIIIGTDAPLSSTQLNLVAKRATLGMGRTGSFGSNGSGDIFLAFSTEKAQFDPVSKTMTVRTLFKANLDPIFRATVEATEEAIINAMVAAEDMEGINGNKAFAIPHNRLVDVMKKYNRLQR